MTTETETTLDADVGETDVSDIHPAARPFLFLGKESVKKNFIWFPLIGMIICVIIGVFYPPVSYTHLTLPTKA